MLKTTVTPIRLAALAAAASLLMLVLAAPAGAAPTTVIASGATAVSAGEYHACALIADGTVRCWGMNSAGQLGNGTTVDGSVPVAVSGIGDATAISVGKTFSCALLEDATVGCRGVGSWGELGDGSGESSSVPVAVAGLGDAVAIDADSAHSCAALGSGQVKCWGNNNAGQLGLGSPIWEQRTPTAVANLGNVAEVSTGRYHSCALLNDGSADCWGLDDFGQLGDGGSQDRYAPVTVAGFQNAVALSAGFTHTCALIAGGSVECWGENSSGQLGDGTTIRRSTPVVAYGIQHAVAVSAGNDYTCAVLEGGAVECWGGRYGRVEGPPPAPVAPPTSNPAGAGAGRPSGAPGAAEPPRARISSHPAETVNPSALFAFTGVAGGSFECSVDGGPWAGCRSGQGFGPLAPGDHRFSVRETLDGVTGPADSYSWTIDLPRACILRVARARVFAFTDQSRARLVIHYKAYEPARVTVSYALSGSRGGLALGSASRRFQTGRDLPTHQEAQHPRAGETARDELDHGALLDPAGTEQLQSLLHEAADDPATGLRPDGLVPVRLAVHAVKLTPGGAAPTPPG